MSHLRRATAAVHCRPCGWSGIVRVYWTATTELWVCPGCLEADETTRLEALASG